MTIKCIDNQLLAALTGQCQGSKTMKKLKRPGDLHLLITSFQKEIQEEGTFAEPVQIVSNISNGLWGYLQYTIMTR